MRRLWSPVPGRRVEPGMVARAARVAVVVGTILVAINQGGVGTIARVALTFTVPFLVSMYSMIGMVPELLPQQRSKTGGAYRCRRCPSPGFGEAVVSPGDPLPSCPRCGGEARWIPSHA
jgi:hypothetical protein